MPCMQLPVVLCSPMKPHVLPEAPAVAYGKDPRTRCDLLRGARRTRTVPDHSEAQEALFDKLESLKGGLKAAGQPRWAAGLEPEPAADKAWKWRQLKKVHLRRWDMARWVKPVDTTAVKAAFHLLSTCVHSCCKLLVYHTECLLMQQRLCTGT
jgi:hypothetical protein